MDGFYAQEWLLKQGRWFSILNGDSAVLLNPPKKINKTFYACDKRFQLDAILDMFNDETSYGVIFLNGKMYTFYRVTKIGINHIEKKKLCEETVDLPKRHKKGGSSSMRFSRLRDEKEAAYIKKLGELVVKWFMNFEKVLNVNKLVIAGPSGKKKLLLENELVQQYFYGNVMTLVTDKLTDKTICDTLDMISNSNEENMQTVVDNIKILMNNDIDKLVFGIYDVIDSLKIGELEYVVVSDDIVDHLNDKLSEKCKLIIITSGKLKRIGLDVVGVKWY